MTFAEQHLPPYHLELGTVLALNMPSILQYQAYSLLEDGSGEL